MTPTRPPLTTLPRDLLSAADYERLAPDFILPATWAWLAGGSGDERCLRESRAAFQRWRIVNRVLQDLAGGHTRVAVTGRTLAHPFLLAPVAAQKILHPEGEVAAARGAAATDGVLVLSTLSSLPLEDVAAAAPEALRWFQLYFQPQREVTLDLLRRAEAAGYAALVVTLDAPVQPASRRALAAGFVMPPEGRPGSLARYAPPPRRELGADDSVVFQGLMAEAPTWADLEWLLAQTVLPVLVKGVAHPDDVRRLRALGVAGFVVSAHGGRALDELPAPLDLLPAVRAAAGADALVLLDGGVRSGADAFKALALGANAVVVGRPAAQALAVAGALGVAHLLRCLREELEVVMALAGCATLADITRDALWRDRAGEDTSC
ncbi:MAG: alpha-hydroxy-acid oxidizing enzyme [Moraxellaceae bacterium]|jgi:isopentenyl diphosphate isomerase/L-lactate dehydrogenase-like FMN-dependent dehydrogenase|nr:alpha-hydroxy-acid oxidizing enzyme [Moraxellaceae bacterium]